MNVLRSAAAILVLAMLAGAPAGATTAYDGDRTASGAEAVVTLSAESLALRELLETPAFDSGPIDAAVLEGIRSYYKSRNYALVWIGDRQASERTVALRERMDAAAADALDPTIYLTPRFARMYLDDPALLAAADFEFSRAVALFVTHVSSGHIVPSDVSRIITLEPQRPDAAEILERLSSAADPVAELASYETPHSQYAALKAKLGELRASTEDDDRIVIPEGALLKPGMADERIPLLRKRFELTAAADADAERYDEALVLAVEDFQEQAGLKVDGIVGPATLALMNGGSREDDILAIVANMERWRWMPRDLGAFHVMVNVPEFMVRVVKDGETAHETRVIVGSPKNSTPTFSHVIDHLIVNPYWNVPASIIANEMLPEIRQNPYGYFRRHGYEVFARINGRFRQIDPFWVNWYGVNPREIQIRQVPGDHNALGRIKFMFPNQHSVYLHDTPSKKLFQRDQRALSHGCVRVQNPLEFADAILPIAAPEWNSDRLKALYGGQERRVDLDTPVPVHLAYFTISIDSDGEIRRFGDVYGYDHKMTAAPET